MSQIDPIQVRLGLIDENFSRHIDSTGETVTGKEVLAQLRKNNCWKNDHEGKYISVQFGAVDFMFRPGTYITVGENVARCLMNSAAICVGGDSLNGPIVPFLQVLEKRELNKSERSGVTATTCGICGVDQKTFPALTRHLGKEKKLHPELFKEETRDWDEEKEEAKA